MPLRPPKSFKRKAGKFKSTPCTTREFEWICWNSLLASRKALLTCFQAIIKSSQPEHFSALKSQEKVEFCQDKKSCYWRKYLGSILSTTERKRVRDAISPHHQLLYPLLQLVLSIGERPGVTGTFLGGKVTFVTFRKFVKMSTAGQIICYILEAKERNEFLEHNDPCKAPFLPSPIFVLAVIFF